MTKAIHRAALDFRAYNKVGSPLGPVGFSSPSALAFSSAPAGLFLKDTGGDAKDSDATEGTPPEKKG